MAYYCMSCKRETETDLCEHCGSEETAFVLKLSGNATDVKVTLNPESDDNPPSKSTFNLYSEVQGTFRFPTMAEFSIEVELTPEQAEQLERMLPKFDMSQLIGLPCPTCGELFTQEFFDAGGGIIRASDDRWQHDHCRSEN